MVKLNGGATAGAKFVDKADPMKMMKYAIIGCLACSIIPAIVDIVEAINQPEGAGADLIACKFGDMGGAMEIDMQNKAMIKNIKDTMKSSADVSKSVIKNTQEIRIEEADDYDDSSPRFMKDQECPGSGLLGLLGFTDKRPAYGCGYDITQDINVEITEIKEDIVEHSEEINNAIMNNLEVEVSGTAGSSDQEKVQEFLNEIRDETEVKVKEALVKARDNSVEQLQKAEVVKIRRPIACPCSGTLTIDQGLQFEIYAQELSEDIKTFVQDKAIESDIDLEIEGAKQDTGQQIACMLQILACCACCLGIILVIKEAVIGKSKQMKAKEVGKTQLFSAQEKGKQGREAASAEAAASKAQAKAESDATQLSAKIAEAKATADWDRRSAAIQGRVGS